MRKVMTKLLTGTNFFVLFSLLRTPCVYACTDCLRKYFLTKSCPIFIFFDQNQIPIHYHDRIKSLYKMAFSEFRNNKEKILKN